MGKQKVFFTELAYVLGVLILAAGTALMERADLGVSMVVAPAYLLHLKIAQTFPAFTFGMAEYSLQAVLLLALAACMRKFKLSYLFSFVTAVFYGFALDAFIRLFGLLPENTTALAIGLYIAGMLLCSLGVALLFHTYIPPEAYELFVKELSAKYGVRTSTLKTVYDCCSCAVGILLSFAFFGLWHFEGVKLGTVLCALVNGTIIGWFSKLLESRFTFRDGLPLRRYFEA